MKQRYDSYKPSGIDWIGDIPSHWNMSSVGKHYQVILGKMLCPKPLDATYTLEEYYCAGDVHFDGVNGGTLKQMWFSPEEKEKYLVHKSDLLIVEGGAGAGGCAVVHNKTDKNIYIQNSILIARHSQNSTVFLKYLIETLVKAGYIDRECNEATFSHFTKEKVCNVPFPVIPIPEQLAIATWLEEKCGEIVAAIAKVDRELELIDELKQSEISRVVTRGLNLDVSLRPSGIDWIGDVPEHWIIAPFKRSLRINNGCDYKHIVSEEGYPVIGSGGQFAFASDYLYDGEVLLLGRKGTIDRPMYFIGKFWTVDTMFYAVPNDNVCCKYMYYQALGFPYDYYSTATALPSMAASDLANNPIIVPPLFEQQAIADHIDKKCAEIDGLKAKLVKKRETLKELRQAIISEVVTGKRKVI